MIQTLTANKGAENAALKVAKILAFYEIHCYLCQPRNDRSDIFLSTEACEILEDYHITRDDNDDAINDALWDTVRLSSLGVDYSATWSAGSDYNGEPHSFKVWLSVGGPSCHIEGDFGNRGIADPGSIKVCYSWYSEPGYLYLTETEQEAFGWYLEEVLD